MGTKFTLITTGILGVLAVVIGAFGAHQLEGVLTDEGEKIFQTGNEYHFYHVLALALTILFRQGKAKSRSYAALFFVAGIAAFSFSLYALAILKSMGITGWHFLGAITPLGGVSFIAGWIFLILENRK
jgi:uncharacterized membrane protein YgdD (TMEM256/DUF423 family)